MMLAAMMKAPAWAITEEESSKLAAAITNVTQFYDVPMLDEKGRAWLSLSMVGFEVYGSRIVTAMMERKPAAKAAQGANVSPIRPQAQAQANPHPTPPGQPTTIDATAIYAAGMHEAGAPA